MAEEWRDYYVKRWAREGRAAQARQQAKARQRPPVPHPLLTMPGISLTRPPRRRRFVAGVRRNWARRNMPHPLAHGPLSKIPLPTGDTLPRFRGQEKRVTT